MTLSTPVAAVKMRCRAVHTVFTARSSGFQRRALAASFRYSDISDLLMSRAAASFPALSKTLHLILTHARSVGRDIRSFFVATSVESGAAGKHQRGSAASI
jgi:hypothetical protein